MATTAYLERSRQRIAADRDATRELLDEMAGARAPDDVVADAIAAMREAARRPAPNAQEATA